MIIEKGTTKITIECLLPEQEYEHTELFMRHSLASIERMQEEMKALEAREELLDEQIMFATGLVRTIKANLNRLGKNPVKATALSVLANIQSALSDTCFED